MIASRVQHQSPRQDVFTGLRAPGLLAKWPIIGLLMAIFGSLTFAALTYNLAAHGPLLEGDRLLANTLPAIGLRSPLFVRDLMDAGFYMGKEVTMVLGVLLGPYFIYKRFWQELAMAMFGWIGGAALFNLFSTVIGRARPPTQIWIVVNIPGFPSGHAVTVVVFYGLLAYLLIPKMPSVFWKVVVVAVALLIIGFVGFSGSSQAVII